MASEHGSHEDAPLFAVSAAFATPAALIDAIIALRGCRLGRLEAFTPVPVGGLAQLLGRRGRGTRPFVWLGSLFGGTATFAMGVYAIGYAYVFDIGGRPRIDWPAMMVPGAASFVMGGTLAALGAMLVLNRLPRLNHHAFNIPGFTRATQDQFFLAVESQDDDFDPEAVERALRDLPVRPLAIERVKR